MLIDGGAHRICRHGTCRLNRPGVTLFFIGQSFLHIGPSRPELVDVANSVFGLEHGCGIRSF